MTSFLEEEEEEDSLDCHFIFIQDIEMRVSDRNHVANKMTSTTEKATEKRPKYTLEAKRGPEGISEDDTRRMKLRQFLEFVYKSERQFFGTFLETILKLLLLFFHRHFILLSFSLSLPFYHKLHSQSPFIYSQGALLR
jgi:hypothetical protein